MTRPAHQAEGLAKRIEAEGWRPVLWPVLEIAPGEPVALKELPDRLARADIAIFISPNAVERCAGAAACLPDGLRIGAVGEGTARTLLQYFGRKADLTLTPGARFDSETLLALPALQDPRGKTVVIVRGAGGREVLADTLRARGAKVEYAEVYRRVCPAQAPEAALESLAREEISVVTVTSGEGLRNLLHLAGALAGRLLELPLVVVSERLAARAAELGFRMPPLVARTASDEAVIEELRAWFAREEKEA